jgi:prepilin-type N-terminal cleavage/methylation domain-containing protein
MRGFTLIELVATILILAMLAVHAVPRMVALDDAAHHAAVEGHAGAFGSALTMAHAACQVAGYAGRDNLSIYGDANVDFNGNCFPASTNGNNGNFNANRCLQVWNGLLAPAPSISTPVNGQTDYRAQGSGVLCTYTYRNDDDTLRRFTYNGSTGAIQRVNP